jgi:hypothetical protein
MIKPENMQNTQGYGRRTNPRVVVTIAAQVTMAHGELGGTVTNLSVGGVFIHCTAKVKVPCPVVVQLSMADGESPRLLSLSGTVVHTRDTGMGVKFDTLIPMALKRLLKVVTGVYSLNAR